MIVTGTISTSSGGKYRLDVHGQVTMPIPCLAHVYRLAVDFENRVVTKHPPAVGDKVMAHFEGDGYSQGYIMGIVGGCK